MNIHRKGGVIPSQVSNYSHKHPNQSNLSNRSSNKKKKQQSQLNLHATNVSLEQKMHDGGVQFHPNSKSTANLYSKVLNQSTKGENSYPMTSTLQFERVPSWRQLRSGRPVNGKHSTIDNSSRLNATSKDQESIIGKSFKKSENQSSASNLKYVANTAKVKQPSTAKATH